MLTIALALLGFSVVAAILLMRTRIRAAANEQRLRRRNPRTSGPGRPVSRAAVRRTADLISWAAGDDRPRISGDTALLLPQDSKTPQRVLAFGTWLPPEPALQMDHAVDALRKRARDFCSISTTSTGRTVEAMGRAIGGQAIVRIRELGGLRRELAEAEAAPQQAAGGNRDAARLRRRSAMADLGQRRRRRYLRYANAAYAQATEAAQRSRRNPAQSRTARQRPPYAIWRGR